MNTCIRLRNFILEKANDSIEETSQNKQSDLESEVKPVFVKKYNFTHDFFILNEENKSLNQKTHAPDCSDIRQWSNTSSDKTE